MNIDWGASILASSITLIGLLVIMGVIYTIWSQINMRKKQKYFKELHTELKPGQEILFAGGIYGTVKEIKETTLLIEVDGNVTLRIDKNMVVADNSDLQRQ